MPIVAKFEVRNMPADTYDQIIKELETAGAGAPHGRLYHICYGDRNGLQVIDVYDSPQALATLGQTLMPILARFGVEAKPDVQEVHNIIPG